MKQGFVKLLMTCSKTSTIKVGDFLEPVFSLTVLLASCWGNNALVSTWFHLKLSSPDFARHFNDFAHHFPQLYGQYLNHMIMHYLRLALYSRSTRISTAAFCDISLTHSFMFYILQFWLIDHLEPWRCYCDVSSCNWFLSAIWMRLQIHSLICIFPIFITRLYLFTGFILPFKITV